MYQVIDDTPKPVPVTIFSDSIYERDKNLYLGLKSYRKERNYNQPLGRTKTAAHKKRVKAIARASRNGNRR